MTLLGLRLNNWVMVAVFIGGVTCLVAGRDSGREAVVERGVHEHIRARERTTSKGPPPAHSAAMLPS